MLEYSIVTSVKNYITSLKTSGIAVEYAVVFGSQANGSAHSESDIDLLVVSPLFDGMRDRSYINRLWRLAARTDSRIEPIPCGSRQWLEDDSSIIIDMARRNGEIVEVF